MSRSSSASLLMLNHPRASCSAKPLRVTDSRSGARLCEPQHVACLWLCARLGETAAGHRRHRPALRELAGRHSGLHALRDCLRNKMPMPASYSRFEVFGNSSQIGQP